ncbi:MAG: tyrosine-type recombinase/integrase [Propionibacteriaceae bacterium]|jgi:integrase|nr:tyrosine-type recombinase/integrase [Propionibacteriaceae bacterium]
MRSSKSKPVDEVADAIIAAMRREAYSELSISLSDRCLTHLRRLCHAAGGGYTRRLGAEFAADTVSPRTGRCSEQRRRLRGRLARLADSYLEDGEVDLSTTARPKPLPASAAFRALLAGWDDHMESSGWAAETVSQHAGYARRYLLHLEGAGCGRIEDAAPASLAAFLESLKPACSDHSSRTVVGVLRLFLAFAGRGDLARAASQARCERARAPLAVLSDEDVAAAGAGLGGVSTRDRAITLLALTTGLRACDICALELGDVDWRAGRISLVQRKTGNPLTLPLPAAAGNAIARYLLQDRPATDDRHVFVRQAAPYRALSGHSPVRLAIKRVFDAAGVAPAQTGTRLTRHTLASRMLSRGVPHPTISAVLGHADPASVDAYLETDAERMRACVLPLPEAVAP